MNRFAATFAAVTFASASFGATFGEAYDTAEKAFERCEGAWFDKSKKAALADLEDAVSEMVFRASALDESHRLQLSWANDYLRDCVNIVYPNSKMFD